MWKQVMHNAALQLGSWIATGTNYEVPVAAPLPEPVVVDQTERFDLNKLINGGAWGENTTFRYSGWNLCFLSPGELLVVPGKKFDHYFRVVGTDSRIVLALPEKKVAHESSMAA